MTRGSRIVAIGAGGQEAVADEILLTEEVEALAEPHEPVDWEVAEEPAAPDRRWPIAVAAATVIAAWTAFFVWTQQGAAISLDNATSLPGLVRDWSIPILLIGVVWLVAMRFSRGEADRFGEAARLLSDESQRLESRLATVNSELSLAREFIAAQSRDLESLGRLAADRLSQSAHSLQDLIEANQGQIETIGTVSEAALDNMEKLRGQLPVIAASARDVTSNIGNAGRTAHAQLQEMISGFKRINEFGQASERQVVALRAQVDAALAEFNEQSNQLETATSNRFAALAETSAAFRGDFEEQEQRILAGIRERAEALRSELAAVGEMSDSLAESRLDSLRASLTTLRDEANAMAETMRASEDSALTAWRASIARLDEDLRKAIATIEDIDRNAVESAQTRLAGLVEEAAQADARLLESSRHFNEELDRRRQQAEETDIASFQLLAAKLLEIDEHMAARRERNEENDRIALAQSDEVSARLAEFDRRITEIADHARQAEAGLSGAVDNLSERITTSRAELAETERDVAGLTDASVRLLELIQAGSQHSREHIPQALADAIGQLEDVEQRIQALHGAAAEAARLSEGVSGNVAASQEAIRAAAAEIEALQQRLGHQAGSHAQSLAGLRSTLEDAEERSERLAEKAKTELTAAIEQLAASATEAVGGIEQMSAASISAIAAKLGEESAAAIDRVMEERAAQTAGQLEEATAKAAGVSREAAIQLRDQLAKVNELAGNLENRVAHARERAEEKVDNDFSRRVALITESLNSNAIDIARALETDVTDTAWASYLKGDRGIFTRRAVSLVNTPEAKSIAQLYEDDRDFRDHVSRYIHDFEAMLRQILSTRDGHALGVTLLSSDMGKLYVALAQAIERLRN